MGHLLKNLEPLYKGYTVDIAFSNRFSTDTRAFFQKNAHHRARLRAPQWGDHRAPLAGRAADAAGAARGDRRASADRSPWVSRAPTRRPMRHVVSRERYGYTRA
jgi:hypothetical protein